MPLHIKYRPKDFDSFVGNKATILSLGSIFDKKREDIPHVFLFTGKSGCGKTTLARIVKEKLHCSDMDFKEINASNNRGIDTARELISATAFKPINGDTRVFLLDEIHQATKDFQNALLKIFEDTPSHVYFLLCTTNPEKILPTIKNRCSTFTVSGLSPSRLLNLLKTVTRSERKKIDIEVLKQIAENVEGSPRQALIALDKIITLEGVDQEQLQEIIQTTYIDEKQVIDLCRALLNKTTWKKISGIIKGIDSEPEKVRNMILGYFNSVLLNGGNPQAAVILDCFLERPFHYTGKAGLTLACYQAIMD